MSEGSSKEKWTCDHCTYQNYQSAIKCTMCRYTRPVSATKESKDIYSLQDSAASNVDDIWNCSECSYTNDSKQNQCSQCYSSRDTCSSENAAAAVAPIEQKLMGLSLTEESNEQICGGKWICKLCTYHNWPRAAVCIMCGDRRPTLNSPDAACSNADNRRKNEASSIDLAVNNNAEIERRRRQARNKQSVDLPWLDACRAVVSGDPNPVEAYLASGGDPRRQLTAAEVNILNRPSAFDVGYTLVHLAVRFHREDLLATLLSLLEGSKSAVKRVPSYVAPDLAADIRRHVTSIMRERKGSSFPSFYLNEVATFALPSEVEDLPTVVQEQLYEELLDRDAQTQLESEPPVINWSIEVTDRLASKLYALWNRSAGDCLLDSAMQASFGVFDRDNTLRRALSESLHQGSTIFFPRWKEYETLQASLMHFSLDESQWQEDWSALLSLASHPGSSLEQLHVFALAHVLRRPIIVYGVKYVKSFRGENLGYARFEGVYLPLLWENSFCSKSPLALGYTRGHFSALVPMEPYVSRTHLTSGDDLQITYLPLQSHDRKLLPVHFLTQTEIGCEEGLLKEWLDVCFTDDGLLVAQQRLDKRPLLVAQMIEEWLNHYRRLAQTVAAPFNRPVPLQDYFSDGDTDDE